MSKSAADRKLDGELKGEGKMAEVIDFAEAAKKIKEKKKGKQERVQLLTNLVEDKEEVEAASKTKNRVTELILNEGMKKPWFMELQLTKLYMGIPPDADRGTIQGFQAEVKYVRERAWKTHSVVKSSEMEKKERVALQWRLTWFINSLNRMESYLSNLLKASADDRKKLNRTSRKELSSEQKKILSDRRTVSKRIDLLKSKVVHDRHVKAKIKKIAGVN
jgi:hypothetical protein